MKGKKPKLAVIDGGTIKGKCPSAPPWLSTQGKAEWKRAAPKLHAKNLLSLELRAMLESYCVAVGMVRETEEIMGLEGRIIVTENGAKPHPAFRMQSTAMREARLLAAELGLTPHRSGVRGVEKGNNRDNKWDADLLA